MDSKNDLLHEIDLVARVYKNGTVEVVPKKPAGKPIEGSAPPDDSRLLASSTSSAEYRCINGQWHYCFYNGAGSYICYPLGIPC